MTCSITQLILIVFDMCWFAEELFLMDLIKVFAKSKSGALIIRNILPVYFHIIYEYRYIHIMLSKRKFT